ncbi:MAG: isoleucine--tRNA ligase [Pirellulaceae bacterium]|nr:isoleucine--tRNA ligase [Pirellulaceae bacterium]
MFEPAPNNVSFPKLELDILEYWKENSIYQQSLKQRQDAPAFVFYEGPPTANGMPHPGHCLTRAIKDLFPRYRTMRGYRCERKAGWDTHGLPVEVEVCKELGIHSKEEIEEYGIEPFIQKCQQSVWRYMQQWEKLTDRLGFWVDLDDAYVTYHQSYVESVWWCLKHLFDRGLLYQGHKIVWWWAQGGTALSSGEVGQGYREVADPSVFIRFPLLDETGQPSDTSLLVWTTTPWTLPSNQFAAVHPDLEYVTVIDNESQQQLIVAKALAETIGEKVKHELEVVATCSGRDLIGRRYLPPFDYYHAEQGESVGQRKDGTTGVKSWHVIGADFVTIDSGTGIVHQAPAFGEVDYEVLIEQQERYAEGEGPELICAVGPDGKFTADAPKYEGRWVKECDKDISRELRERGLLFHQEQYLHDYPFCWRAEEDPLIQYPRRSWFVRTTQYKDQLLANNQQINWLPDHIQEGRFGNFLESNVDWALSRERYWGTPLPIWVCEQTGKMEAFGSYDELLEKPGVSGTEVWQAAKAKNNDLPDDLRVHKPYIDEVTYDSPFASGAKMRRVTEVIDCWFDSGAMPFAQWGYPHQNREAFENQFPADFISEAIDQTRGWFYSLLAISTLMFGPDEQHEDNATPHAFPHPYRNCIVLGLMLGEDGAKMSKSKRNYLAPDEIFDQYGADALRWYFFANQAPWTSIRYSERSIKDSIPEFLLRLWHVYSFFVIYANIDGFDPGERLNGQVDQVDPDELVEAQGFQPIAQRAELDRWILSELNKTCTDVTEKMDAYDSFNACASITAFVDALSNWYVRRSRDRFWSSDKESQEKLDAYWTLYECLITTSKIIAPFVPFLAEHLWRNLTNVFSDGARESVHLCDFPAANTDAVDEKLSHQMQLAREISSLGRSARMNAKLKVRQPLAKVEVILANDDYLDWLQNHVSLIKTELNVKEVEFTRDAETYISYQIQPNFKRLGPRIGKLMPAVKKLLGDSDGGVLMQELEQHGKITLSCEGQEIALDNEDIQIRLQAREGWAAAQGTECVVVLSTELSDELLREGLARDVVRLIQDQRKQADCQYTDRIRVEVATESDEVGTAIVENLEYIQNETLASQLDVVTSGEGEELEIGSHQLRIQIVVE